ncbi:probable cytochrome P450 12a5, mitochondrial [Anastrepha obliqua]|uniref:probable cytochrome P450 12a5, mitochondrial n=1 Tax=Anastrepha obliqua TaxID=95512 RepID=UPI00240A8EE6|nr:probable cytochrome P450 12a5, mitochondrial [Anastrepha obliqua]
MLSVKANFVTARKGGSVTRNIKATTSRLLAAKQAQLYQQSCISNLSTENQPTDVALEWQRARPFSEIPKASAFKFISKFLPGGPYSKLDFSQLVTAMLKDYGPIFLMPAMPGRPSILVTHNPDDFENLFRNEGAWPIRPLSEAVRYYRNKLRADFFEGVEGVIATHGEQWSSFRTIVNPILMKPKNTNMYLNKMAQVNQEFVDKIRLIRNPDTLEMPDDFKEYLQRWALESVAIVALDKQLGLLRDDSENSSEVLKLFSALNDFMELSFDLEYKPTLWRVVATPKFRRLMRAMDDIKSVTWKFVTEAVRKLEVEKQQGIEQPEHKKSVLERLIKRNDRVAAVMAMDMMMAGVDTTTSLVAGALLCLAKNPEKQARLRAEVMRVLPQKNSNFTADALNNIPYLRACLKESLRVYPIAIGNMRVPQNDLVLSGYRVPKGTLVSMIFSTLQANERYFARPLEYLPERWLRSGEEDHEPNTAAATKCAQSLKPSSPFVYLPFGFGPRVCVGRRISELEVEAGIARLVRNFNIEFNYPTDNAFKSVLINMPNIPLRFKLTDID